MTIFLFLKANPHFGSMEFILCPVSQHQGLLETESDYTCGLLSATMKAEIYNK